MTLLLWLFACVHVPTWQRAALLSEQMTADFDPLGAAFAQHVHETREAISGASASAGVPCGCN